MTARVLCSACQRELGEDFDAPGRRPCPTCGSTARTYEEHGVVAARAFVSARWKHRRPGYGKFLAMGMSGFERSVRTGRMVEKQSFFDKDTDRRYERITDVETGEVLHECDHKLTDHKGHGSAKKTKA